MSQARRREGGRDRGIIRIRERERKGERILPDLLQRAGSAPQTKVKAKGNARHYRE